MTNWDRPVYGLVWHPAPARTTVRHIPSSHIPRLPEEVQRFITFSLAALKRPLTLCHVSVLESLDQARRHGPSSPRLRCGVTRGLATSFATADTDMHRWWALTPSLKRSRSARETSAPAFPLLSLRLLCHHPCAVIQSMSCSILAKLPALLDKKRAKGCR
jgi:hypothetical protein